MNWSHELIESVIWLAKAFAYSLLAATVVATLLARYTSWGRQFWRLAGPYFKPARSWRPILVLMLVLLMTLFAVRMNVLFSFWYNSFYSALQKLDASAAWYFLGIFGILATVHVGRSLLNYYISQSFEIHWRVWLNDTLVERWLSQQAYYRAQYVDQPADNPDQRIQQDVASFVTSSVSLSMGLVNAVVSLIAFTAILWGLSGPLAIFGLNIERAMVWLAYGYVLIATLLAFQVGRPLIGLSFLNEKLNANYRYALVRLREYKESIAFFGGEAVERKHFAQQFGLVIDNVWAIVHRTLKLSGFNLAISQAAVVFPLLVQLPRFLAKQISLGDMMQTANSFNQVQDALSFFRESYDNFADYRAVLNRLTGFCDAIEAANDLPRPSCDTGTQHLGVNALTLTKPDRTPLVANLSLDIASVQPLLVRGSSGCGKTTLLRSIAGLWPYGEGKVNKPAGLSVLFLAQKPYLPLGTLREALHYPGIPGKDERASDVLIQCRLGHLVEALDQEQDWSHILSLGEQQRLAFGRILLNRPGAVFLDEATSAMDEDQEAALYRLLQEALPQTMVVSIGHRSTLRAFHRTELTITGDGHWNLNMLPTGTKIIVA